MVRDAAELESYEAKAEEAVDYLRHKRPWHVHHKEWFVIIMRGMLQHATVAMFGDEQEADALIAGTAEYLALTQADPADGAHKSEARVQVWMRGTVAGRMGRRRPLLPKDPQNARPTVSACLAAQALTRYLPDDVATWEQWGTSCYPSRKKNSGTNRIRRRCGK